VLPAQAGDCGIYPGFNIDVGNVVKAGPPPGVLEDSTPVAALRDALANGSPEDFAQPGGLVALGYPSAGWTAVKTTSNGVTFQAPLHAGTAQLSFEKARGKWLLSGGRKDC